MKIIDIRDATVPLQGDISNAVVNFSAHTVSLVAVTVSPGGDRAPVTGFAFNSIGRFGQSGILRERMIPRLMACEPDELVGPDGMVSPAKVLAVALRNEKPGGHGDRCGAAGALELAIWDANAKLAGEPAWQTISRAFGTAPEGAGEVPVYAAGGYYYAEEYGHTLRDELSRYRDLGFTAFKMKIGGASLAEDIRRIEEALDIAEDGANLAVDANGRFDMETALAYGRAIEPFGLRWYEEIGDPLDYQLNRTVSETYRRPIATGENLFSARDVTNLVRYGGMRPGQDVFQMDPGLSYGLSEFVAMIDVLEANGFHRAQVHPHGGHLINLHIATGLGLGGCEAYPGVFDPFGGYPAECALGGGTVRPTDAPGFGLEQKTTLRPHLEALVA